MDPCLIVSYYPVEKNLWLGLQATMKVSESIALLLDDALKPAMPLINAAINETA